MHNIPIIYEDDWLLVVDKPCGLLAVPTPKNEKRTLTSILNFYPCHRLDRETSGLVIYAKTKAVQQSMMDEFKQKAVQKKYLAFVQGYLSPGRGRISLPIEAKNAVTDYKVIQRKKDFTVAEVRPLTGRTNQIRIHFKAVGYPLVGESRFSFRRDFKLRAKRLCLHAQALEFSHPVTKKTISLESPLPPYLKEFLAAHE